MKARKKVSHIGIYAQVLSENNTHVLLIKKSRGPYTGLYDLPGGTPDFLESLDETLKREVYEETSLHIKNSQQLISFLVVFEKNNIHYRHLGVIYSVEATGVPKSDSDGEDSNGCIWLSIDEISEKICSPFVCQLKCEGYLKDGPPRSAPR